MLNRLRARAAAFRRDQRGGVIAVLAFSVVAAAVVISISAVTMMNSTVTLSQRITQSAEAGVREAVDTVLSEVNTGGQTTQATLDGLIGREFPLDAAGVLQGVTTIEDATMDGQSIRLVLSVTSTGRMEWERTGTATLQLANAVSLSRIDEGRAVWDYTAPSGANSVTEYAVALWTPGEVSVFVPGARINDPTAPAPAIIRATETSTGDARFQAFYAGGCWKDESAYLELTTSFVDASGTEVTVAQKTTGRIEWNPTTGEVSKTTPVTATVPASTGWVTASVDVRIRCEGARTSHWATASKTLGATPALVDFGELAAPTITFAPASTSAMRYTFEVDASGLPAGVEVAWRYRSVANYGNTAAASPSDESQWADAAWSAWSSQNTVDLPGREGEKRNIQAQYRVSLSGQSAESPTAAAVAVREITTKPALTDVVSSLAGSTLRASGDLSGCPAHLAYQLRSGHMVNAETAFTWGTFTTATSGSQAVDARTGIREGDRGRAALGARCVSPYTQGPEARVGGTNGHQTRLVLSKPTLTDVTSALSGSTLRVTGTLSGCPAHLTYQVRGGHMVNAATAWTWGTTTSSGLAAGTRTVDAHTGIREGDRARAALGARCESPYSDGPEVQAADTNGYKTRPIATAPTVVTSSVISGSQLNTTVALSGCPSHLGYQWQTASAYNSEDWTAWSAFASGVAGNNVKNAIVTGIREGDRAAAYGAARCKSAYATGPIAKDADDGFKVRPITTKPTVTLVDVGKPGSSFTLFAYGTRGTCAAHQTIQWQYSYLVNSETTWRPRIAPWADPGVRLPASDMEFVYDTPKATINAGLKIGDRVRAAAWFRCATLYTGGPEVGLGSGYVTRTQ